MKRVIWYPIIGLFVPVLFSFISYGQYSNGDTLEKGMKIPDIPFTMYTHDTASLVRISDFKGKVVLFDFWATNCSSCVAGLPKLMEFQKAFGEQIKIIEVARGNTQNREAVMAFWKKLRGHASEKIFYAAEHLPFIYEDSVFQNMFHPESNGCVVWVDRNGFYHDMGTELTMNKENINLFLNGQGFSFDNENKEDFLFNTDPATWLEGSGTTQYSFFADFIKKGGMNGSAITLTDSATNQVTGLAMVNQSILDFYKAAYAWGHHLNPSRSSRVMDGQIVLEVKHPDRFIEPAYKGYSYIEWIKHNTYCYGSKSVPEDSAVAYRKFISDLDHYFNLESHIETRKIKCVVLTRLSSNYSLLSKGGDGRQVENFSAGDTTGQLVYRNVPFLTIMYGIEDVIRRNPTGKGFITIKPMLLNKSLYSSDEYVDIDLPDWYEQKIFSLEDMRKSLNKYGLDLIEEWLYQKVLVLRDHITDQKERSFETINRN